MRKVFFPILAGVILAAPRGSLSAPETAQAGTVSGKVVRTGEAELVIATADAREHTFRVPAARADAPKEQKNRTDAVRIAATKALRPGVPVTVAWLADDENTKTVERLTAGGTVTGTVVGPRDKLVLRVKVEGIDGPMAFVARWVKQNNKWAPKTDEVRAFAGIPTGARVSISYELDEHFRVDDLKMIRQP